MELMPTPIIEARDLVFTWQTHHTPVLSLEEFTVSAEERVFIKGPSGSGKSTLLSLLGGVMRPQRGDIEVLGQPLARLTRGERDRFRADHVGFVFQMFNLIPYLSVIENVTLPCRFSKRRRERLIARNGLESEAVRLLGELGIGDRALIGKKVTDLSVGQQQRVAVARALLGAPEIVVADEPTSALDTDLRDAFIKLLMQECEENSTTLIFVSHDGGLARYFDRVVDLQKINRAH